MVTYFERHRQRYTQWQRKRRNGFSAVPQVVVHTYEAPAGRSAEAGARYLLTRATPGSYHWLADALGDSLHLAPWSAETWHCVPSNNWSVGISMMAHAAGWSKLTETQRDNLVNGAALGAHRFSRWCVAQGLGPVPARRITRAQAMRREAGFISHGEMDPGRRSDPGAGFPWSQFFAEFRRLEAGNKGSGDAPAPTPTPEDWFTMATLSDLKAAIKEHTDPIPRRILAQGIDLTTAQQKALATGRKTWRLDQLLATLAHRIGTAFQRTGDIKAEVEGLREAVLAVGEAAGMDRAQVQRIVTDTIARASVSLELPEED